VVRLDLADFYPSVTYSRVVALFRSLGYCREIACWLARLTTTTAPQKLLETSSVNETTLFRRRHLPQGAPTSPALANLSAFVSDLRLDGLARSFGVRYTRYADDLTFSGPATFRNSLRIFIPLVRQILKQERFHLHPGKRRVERASQRQQVTGVVVNAKVNCCRHDFDLLKAILTNCLRHGPSGQNRDGHLHFASHLRGRIAHIARLNERRGRQLLAIYQQIDWTR
jgi:RNA-directed DNA polymerase